MKTKQEKTRCVHCKKQTASIVPNDDGTAFVAVCLPCGEAGPIMQTKTGAIKAWNKRENGGTKP